MVKSFIFTLTAILALQQPNYRKMAVERPDELLSLIRDREPSNDEEFIDMEISRAVALTKVSRYDSVLSVLDDLQAKYPTMKPADEFAIYYQRARAYYFKGDYKVGIEHALRTVSISETSNEDSLLVVGKMFLGELYRASDNNQFAEKYLVEARDLALRINHKLGLAYSTNRLGVVLFARREHDSADSLFSASMKIAQEIMDINVITMNLNDQGELYFALGQPEKSVSLYEKALELDLPLDVEINTYNNMANALAQMKEYEQSIVSATKALELADQAEILSLSERASRIIADCYMSKGDYEQGIIYYRRYMNYRGRLFDAKKDAQIAELETKYEVEKNRLLLNSQARELEVQRRNLYLLVIGLSSLGILLLAVGYFYIRSRRLRLQLAESNRTKDKLFAIVSHDLRSSLSAFQGIGALLSRFLDKKEYDKLEKTVMAMDKEATELHQLLDNLLNWSISQMGKNRNVTQEFSVSLVLKSAIELYERLAALKGIEIKSEIQEANVLADKSAMELVVRNLVSNAIKFTEEGGTISIGSHAQNGQVEITIADTGVGLSAERRFQIENGAGYSSSDGTKGEKGTGLGLKVCSEYLKMHGSQLKVEENQPKGTIFKFQLQQHA